eukprot:scaffold132855_cov69-Phaeocystis_antarctica.AAC.1
MRDALDGGRLGAAMVGEARFVLADAGEHLAVLERTRVERLAARAAQAPKLRGTGLLQRRRGRGEGRVQPRHAAHLRLAGRGVGRPRVEPGVGRGRGAISEHDLAAETALLLRSRRCDLG